MGPADIAWVVGGYLAGTFPSTWLVAHARHSRVLQEETGRRAGETDPHVLASRYLGVRWSALASTTDVLKGFLVVLLARHLGNLDDSWLSAVAVAAVLGHTFPPYLARWAGRGLAATAGVLLVILPLQMVVAGLLIVLGIVIHASGILSTVALASIPVLAWIQGQPAAFIWAAVAILIIIVARRLEGVGDVIRTGVPWPRAVVKRALFDVSEKPPLRGEEPPSG